MKSLINTKELEVYITRSGLTKKEIAKEMGISTMTLYKKINNITEFKASELETISKLLGINDLKEKNYIFFSF